MKSTYCAGLEHSEDEYWKKPRFGAANFLETLQDDEGTLQLSNRWCESEKTFSRIEASGKRRSVEVATGGVAPSPEVATGLNIPQRLSVDEKANSIAVQNSSAYEVSMDSDQKAEELKTIVGYGAAPSPMEQQRARATMAVADAMLMGKIEEDVQSTDEMFGSAIENKNEQLKEKLDNVAGFEAKSQTEEDPGILEEERNPKIGISLNAFASSEEKEMVNVEDTSEVGNASLKVEELLTSVLPPYTVEDDHVVQRIMVSCTDEQQTFVTQPACEMEDVLAEVSRQEDSSLKTEYDMETRGDNSRREAVRMQLTNSFVAPDDSSIVPIQVNCQASPKPYHIDSSMQSPKVTIGAVVGELNSINKVSSLSSNNSEQKMGAMPLKQHSIALDQDLVTKVNSKSDVIFSNLAHIGTSILFWMQKWWKLTVMVMFQIALILEKPDVSSISHWSCKWKCVSLEQTKVVVLESDQPLSDREVVVLSKNIVQGEFEETSNAIGSIDKQKESPRLSGISEAVPFATTRSKETVVNAEAGWCGHADQNESRSSPTTIENNVCSRESGVLKTNPCVVVKNEVLHLKSAFHKNNIQDELEASTNADKLEELEGSVYKQEFVQLHSENSTAFNHFHKSSTTYFNNASAYEASVRQRIKACCTDRHIDSRMRLTNVYDPWMEGGLTHLDSPHPGLGSKPPPHSLI
ncbi:unnamed protein product [Sphagnum jensenii]|uniref:Uncharacterized protein n=1 Tax=Sphagnum jensenii TaxID=128206 RepID=A0ABP0VIJ9_9BRYO